MKIKCLKNDLLLGLNTVSKAVPAKTTLSILECILVDANSNKITLVANDMDLGIESVVEGEIIEAGAVAITARMLVEIVKNLPDDQVVITSDNKNNVIIECGSASFNIMGNDALEFSPIPEVITEKSINVSQFSLREVIRQTIFSKADNEAMAVMTGENFVVKGNKLKVTALDGHRIAIREIELKESYEDINVVVPGKTLNEITKILNGGIEDMVRIDLTNNHILFSFEGTRVVSRLIDGKFIPVEKMISKDYETKITCNKRELIESIKRAHLMVESDKKPIIFSISEDILKIDILSAKGSMEDEVEIKLEGGPLNIAFNPKFMIDALSSIEDEEISIFFVNSKNPCVIRNEECEYVYIILPVSI